ncbi:MAG: biopolymer transporter ExbD [Myxococcota bacterium]
MGAQLGTKGAFSDINMTPLIDIVLVVLIIMMVNIPIQIEEMGLKLPSNKPPPDNLPQDSEQLVIAMYAPDEEGGEPTIALNRRAMDRREMIFEITRRLPAMAKKNVFVDADLKVKYGDVVDMVDLAREAGAENVGLAKVKTDDQGNPTGPLPITSVSTGANMVRGVVLGSPRTRGELDAQTADASLRPLKGNIQQCYLQRLAARPDLTGSYTLYVEVGPQGEFLKDPVIEEDTVGDPDLATCVAALLPNLRYRPLGEGKTAWIRYPVLFSPGGG